MRRSKRVGLVIILFATCASSGIAAAQTGCALGTAGCAKQQSTTPAQPVKNIHGEALSVCSSQPMTGWFRDGSCRTNAQDRGRHVVCAVMTEAFLQFTRSRGNDLSTPKPDARFPGLKPNDRWCLCALRWREAQESGFAPPVITTATHAKATDFVFKSVLIEHGQDTQAAPKTTN